MEALLRVGLSNAVAAGLLALGAASAGIFLGRRPALRHGLWLLVLLKLVTPPLWNVPLSWLAVPAVPATSELVALPADSGWSGSEKAPVLDLLLESGPEVAGEARGEHVPAPAQRPWLLERLWSWPAVAFGIWAGGSLLTFGVAAWRIRRFQRLLELAEPVSKATEADVEALVRRLGLGRAPKVWQVPGAVSPMLWALGGAPRLIVPRTLWDRLDQRQRATLLAHELAHLRRRDHWVRCLELLVTGLYWWLPVVWIARHALREAEEQCCDAWVVWTFPDAARTYALALLETLDFLAGAGPAVTFVVAASGLGPVHHLKRRMTMIMQGTTPRALTWSGLLAVLGLSALLLPLSPTWAQRPDDSDAGPPAAAPERSDTRDTARPDARETEVRVFRVDPENLSDEALAKELEKLQAAIDKVKEKVGGRLDGPLDQRNREAVEQALGKMQDELTNRLQSRLAQARRRRGDSPRVEEGEREEKLSDEKSDIKRLRAEVDERRKALREAEMKLAQAMKRLAGEGSNPGPRSRSERFEFRFGPGEPGAPHSEPGVPHGPMMRPGMPPHPPMPPAAMRPGFARRPDQDKRIAELEERLEKLQDEVKSMKKDAPEKR